MTKKAHKIFEINHDELSALITRVETAIENNLALTTEDMKLLLMAITTLCNLQSKIEQNDITLNKLRKLLGMVQQSEKRKPVTKDNSNPGKKKNKNKNPKEGKEPKKKSTPVKIVHHTIENLRKGDICPECQRGKIYKFEPAILLRITGNERYESTRHIVEQMRCNACQKVYKAPLPESVLEDGAANQKYGFSARALMVIDKFYSGLPYYHQGNLTSILGCPISASTIFDQCEVVANAVMPVFYELQRQAGQAKGFLIDDTHHRILTQKSELRDKPNGKGQSLRTGIYASGLIAECDHGKDIILFDISLGHAGEHLDKILSKREVGLPPPTVMSDALSSNTVTKTEIVSSYCNAHARRQFYDLEKLYPNEVGWLLERYAVIWKNEDFIEEQGLDKKARLQYHQKHSLPVMQEIQEWALKNRAAKEFEEHSAFGKATLYFLKHYDRLIMFCKVEGALIDNNRMEEKLKLVIRVRKTSHFYKTPIGAEVANVLTSIISTTNQAQENIFDYLQVLQKNQALIKLNPSEWLPWNYRETFELLKSNLTVEDQV